MTILIYHYDDQYLYKTSSEARMNPLDPSSPLVPANATVIEPMGLIDLYTIQQFTPATASAPGVWSIIYDYRGYRYFTLSDGEVVINDINITPPEDAVEMSADDRVTQEDDGTWRLITPEDDLNALKTTKINQLKESFSLELKNDGLNSSALGVTHKYDAEQHNIDWILACVLLTTITETDIAHGVDTTTTVDDAATTVDDAATTVDDVATTADDAATTDDVATTADGDEVTPVETNIDHEYDATAPLITCDDLLDGPYSKQSRAHTRVQCSQLLLDGMTAIQAIKDKLAGLEIDVANAVDEAEIDAIVW